MDLFFRSVNPRPQEIRRRKRRHYLTALLCVIAISLAGSIPSFRMPLLVLAVAGAGAAILFLLRFLRANDEHER